MIDILFLSKYVEDVRGSLINARVDKIYQPKNLEVTLTLRNPGETINLRIDCSAEGNNFRITNQLPQNPTSPSAFCMLLRKYLIGSKIVHISSVENERIVNIVLQGRHPEGYVTKWVLTIELMGKHSNLILYHEDSNNILGLLKPISSSIRELRVGSTYQLPPAQSKILFDDFSTKTLLLNTIGDHSLSLDKIIIKYFPMGSPILAKEFIFRQGYSNQPFSQLSDSDVDKLVENYQGFIKSLKFQPIMYYVEDEKKASDFYCLNLETLENKYNSKVYPNFKQLVQDYFDEKELESNLSTYKTKLNKLIGKYHKKLTKKYKALNKELIQYKNSGHFKEIGDLLMSNLHQIKKGMTEVTIFNYYTSKEEAIKLDPSLSPIANSQAYYKKHSKAKRGLNIVKENLEAVKGEIDYLDSLNHFVLEGSMDDLKEIEQELIKGGYIKPQKEAKDNKKQKQVAQTEPMEFTSSQGYKILVGKNNRQNDLLSLKIAKKGDLWLHTKELAGSHVIIKDGENAPEETLTEAATLAAFYSKGKHSANVAVDYTQVKNVFKPKGAKPGMVNYLNYKTVYVTPKES